MKIIDRYIGHNVALGILVIMLILLAFYTFVALLNEMERVGTGHYGIIAAISYVLYTVPKRIYELFPVSALIGTLVSLGGLSANSELTAMRAAGISIMRIGQSVLRIGGILMLAVILIGEFIAPEFEQHATRQRALALGQQIAMKGRSGFWARDGNAFINIKQIHPGGRLTGLTIYQLDKNHRLKTQIQAAMATYYNDIWQLAGIVRRTISQDEIITEQFSQTTWKSLISPALLEVIMVKPDALSIIGLYNYIEYLTDNHLDASRYLQTMWTKLIDPFTTVVMVLLALPFIFGPLRSVSLTQRVLTGFLVGIFFHIINRAFIYIGQIYLFSAAFTAAFPTLLFFVITVGWLKRGN